MTPLRDGLQHLVDKRFKGTPDAGKQVKAFITKTRSRIFAVDALEMTRRLLEETVAAFEAKGGMVTLCDDTTLLMTRNWDGDAHAKVPIQSGKKIYGYLALAGRTNGAEYSVRDLDVLRSAASEAAVTIEQDEPLFLNKAVPTTILVTKGENNGYSYS